MKKVARISVRAKNMDEKKILRLKSYIKAGTVWLVLLVLAFWWENPFQAESIGEIFTAISNAFTIPGVIMTGLGGLTYLASKGAYDGLGYAFSNFGLHNVWMKRQPKKYKTLYDYKAAKDEKGRKWLPSALVFGLISLALGVISLVIYYIVI